jgi:hypothetical protein
MRRFVVGSRANLGELTDVLSIAVGHLFALYPFVKEYYAQ